MLSVEDLAGMRETVTSALPDTCSVVSRTDPSDGHGGHTKGATASVSYPCRISPRLATGTGQLKDAEIAQAGRIVAQAPWLITFPYETPVSTVNQITDTHDRTFEVFAVLEPRSDELATLVLARLIGEGAG